MRTILQDLHFAFRQLKNAPAFAPIDLAVLKFMDTIGCQTATIAISEDGRLVYSRGYGWSESIPRVSAD